MLISFKKIFCNFLLIFVCILVSSCSSSSYHVDAYKVIGSELQKSYKLDRSDLIVAYDLGRIDKTNCIYSADLGTIINDRKYKYKYISQFKANYKSPITLKKEAIRKVKKICKLLLDLHRDYRILQNSQYRYVKRLSKTDLATVNLRQELGNLDKVISFVPVMLPVKSTYISSKYGNRIHPLKKQKLFHCGLDIVAKSKSTVYAAANGVVVFAGRKNGYGNVVELKHGPILKTVYAHLDKITVRKGNKIARGRSVGVQGSTGNATNEHLHFEVWVNNKHVNPYDFIASECTCRLK